MTRAFVLLLLATGTSAAAEPNPVVFAPPGKTPDGARFRIGRPTHFMTQVLAFAPDGKTVAVITNTGYTGGIDAPVDLWDVTTGKHVATLHYHKTGVMAAAFSPDGSMIATSGIDNRLRLWDAKTFKDITKQELELTGHGYNLHFSPDSKQLLVGSTRLELYDVATQKPVTPKHTFFAEAENGQFYHTATWSPKGAYIAAGADGGGVRVWDAKTGKLLYQLSDKYTPHRTRFAFSADDSTVALATWPDGLFSTFDARTGKELTALKPPGGQVSPESVQFAREANRVAWLAQTQQHVPGTGRVVVADLTGKELKRFDVPSNVLSHLFSPDGKRLVTAGHGGSLRVYEADTGKLERTILGEWGLVFGSAYAGGGKTLRTVHTNGIVHDFDADTGTHAKERTLDLKGEQPVALSADGKYLVTAADAGTFTIWNLETGESTAKPKVALFVYRERVFGPGGPFPLPPGPPVPGPAPGARPAPAPAAQPVPPGRPGGGAFPPPPPVETLGPPQYFASFSADGKQFVALTGKEGDTATVFDTATGEEKANVKVPKGTGAVAVSADGSHLFVGQAQPADAVPQPDDDPRPGENVPGTVRRLDLKTGKEVQSWKPTAGAERMNLKFTRTEVTAIHALADKETLLVVESHMYMPWPPPPGAPGGRVPAVRHPVVRVINLAGREKERTLPGSAVGLGVAADGKSVAFLVDEPNPQKPVTLVKVTDVASGKSVSAQVASGHHGGFGHTQPSRGVSFRPGGKDVAVRTGDGTVLVIDTARLK